MLVVQGRGRDAISLAIIGTKTNPGNGRTNWPTPGRFLLLWVSALCQKRSPDRSIASGFIILKALLKAFIHA